MKVILEPKYIYAALVIISLTVLSAIVVYLSNESELNFNIKKPAITDKNTASNNSYSNDNHIKTIIPEYIPDSDYFNPTIPISDKSTIRMTKSMGVYKIPVMINGITLNFILDTGASIISISEAEAIVLYKQGMLDESDFRGTKYFLNASGGIVEGTMINLRSVKIGDHELNNILASVMHNSSAPLLLGQSFLEKFGVVTIDYRNMILYFND